MNDKGRRPVPQRVKNLSLAAVAGQAGFASLTVVFIALFLGIWLDSLLGWRGPLTCCMVGFSVPVSLFIMLRIALGAVGRIQPPVKKEKQKAETEIEEV